MSTLSITLHYLDFEAGIIVHEVPSEDSHRDLFKSAEIGTEILFYIDGKRHYGSVARKSIVQGAAQDWSLYLTLVQNSK